MTVAKKSPGYQVDLRVSIQLDALDQDEQRAILDVIQDRAHFLATTADRRKVRRISKTKPLFALKLPRGLRLIYSQVGDEIIVMDLLHEKVLAFFRGEATDKPKRSGTRKARAVPGAGKAK
jgi:hypothetical protein